MDYLVAIRGLEIRDEHQKLLSSGDLEIAGGSTLAIFGPGGSGKSLLLKYIYGLQLENLSYKVMETKSRPDLTYFLDRNGGRSEPAEIPQSTYDLYLIDEPENGYSIDQFHHFRDKVAREQSALIFVTHHLGFLEEFAEEIMVLKYGESKGKYSKHAFFNNQDPYIDYLSKMGC